MSDDAKLQIILEAVNQTANPFTELNTAIESFQKSASELAKSIEESFKTMTSAASSSAANMEDSIKGGAGAFEDLAKAASEQTRATEESMSGVNKSATDMAKAMSESAADIEKDMKAAATSMNEFEKTAATDLAAAGKEMNALRENMNKGIGEIGGLIAIQMLGQSMEELGKKGEHLFDFAVEQGSDFQQSMQNIKTVIAANADGTGTWSDKLQGAAGMTDELQQKALELGSRGAQSANQVAEAMDTMLRAGVDAKTVYNGAAEAAQNVAIVTGDKLDESANLVTEIYHQFRESFAENGKSMQENMKTTGDVLTGTLLSARINSQDFLDTLKYVGPVASQLGSSFLDTATATAVLAQNGIKGSQAGNNLKRALTNLLEPTKQGAAAMQHLGLIQNGHNKLIDESTGKMKNLTEIQDILHSSMEGLTEVKKAQYIHDMFGQYALAGTLVLANENSEAFSKLKEHIGNVSAENAASAMLNTFSGHMAQLKAHVETTAKEFGLAFLPVLEKLVPIGQNILNWLQSMSPATKEFLMGALGIGSAMAIAGGALATFAISAKFAGEGIEAIQAMFTIFEASNPVGWIILLATAVVASTVLIVQHWDEIKDWVLRNFGIDIPKVMSELGDTFTLIWNDIKDVVQSVWDYIRPTIMDGVKAISEYWQAIWPLIKQLFVDVWNFMKDFLVPILTYMTLPIQAALGFIKGAWEDTWNAIKDLFKLVWDVIVDEIRIYWDVISGVFKVALDLLTGHWSDAWNDMKSMLSNVWNDIKQLFGNFVNDALSFGSDFVKSIANGISGAVSSVISAATNVVNQIRSIFSSAPTAPTVSAPSYSSSPDSGYSSDSSSMGDIPAFGDGAKVTKPTLAWIAERGETEYVIPESKLSGQNGYTPGYMPPVMGGGASPVYNIIVNANGNITENEQKLGDIVSTAILNKMKFQGKIG